MPIKQAMLCGLWILCTCVALALGGNTHQSTGDIALEQRAWWGDALASGYVVQDCLPGTSATTSVSIATCRAYTLKTDGIRQLEYVEELSSQVVSLTVGPGTYWLIVHSSTTDTVAGWTRAGLSHYLWQLSATAPAVPTRATLVAQLTVSGSAVTTVLDWRASNPVLPQVLRVTDPLFGAMANDTLDDQAAIQRAFVMATRGHVIIEFPPGTYRVGADPLQPGAQMSLRLTNVEHVIVRGYGATILQGADSVRLLGVYNSRHVKIEGFRLIGHTQNISSIKHGIVIGETSYAIEVAHNYVTNFLGDQLYIGGNLSAPFAGLSSSDIWIHHNTFKERIGNALSSENPGGTGSRLAVGIVDARYVTLESNTIFGQVDIEPDADNQYSYHIHVTDNVFNSGPVQAQAVVGTAYNHDEPLLAPGAGGTVVDGVVTVQGAAATPILQDVHITGNRFERGRINCLVDPYTCTVEGNTFNEGLIHFSQTSGAGIITNLRVNRNVTRNRFTVGETAFIRLDGYVANSTFIGNIATIPGGYVFDDTGANTGDNGRNVYLHNLNLSSTAAGVLGFVPLNTSVVGQSYFNQNAITDHLTTLREVFTGSINLLPRASPPPSGFGEMYSDTSQALCWFDGNIWVKIAGPGTCS